MLKKIMIIGIGFIGIELACELKTQNKDVTVIGGRHILVRYGGF
jgi:NADPH-dependent 2,4-dienoyl-CoA reductase/sulfur reductase-like enzyme